MKLGLNLQASLQQTLTPQQIQYLKLLQLSALQFEQHVRTEMENNPMLEEAREDHGTENLQENRRENSQENRQENLQENRQENFQENRQEDFQENFQENFSGTNSETYSETYSETNPEANSQTDEGFDFYKLLWGEDPSASRSIDYSPADDDDDDYGYQVKEVVSLEEELIEQLRYLPIPTEQRLFGEYVIGNVDNDGYLRRPLDELIAEINANFAEHNLALQAPELLGTRNTGFERDIIEGVDAILEAITPKIAEVVLRRIQSLDPPGFASRTVQECLIAQLRAVERPNAAQKLALLILTQAYDAFAMKHYHVIERQLEVTEDYLREALDVIRHLNPRPGGGTFGHEINTVVPDFTVERNEDGSDVLITVNDSRLPILKVSNAYERLKKESKHHKFNKETREFLRKKFEDAKFLMQAIRQRKHTMLRVMTAIAGLQKDFFFQGPSALKPLIYRDVAEITGLDISTVCRIVNGKYVQTEFGTFELKYFFSESLITDDGEEVSTRIIKQKIKEMIEAESKNKPLSDEKIAKNLKTAGYNVARRTVAKYREQLRIPVARLRREL